MVKIRKTGIKKPATPITSLIDISMLLLIYFMLTSNFIKPKAINITPPSAKHYKTIENRRKIYIIIDRNGSVFLNGRVIGLDNIPNELRNCGDNSVIIVKADRETAFKNVVHVMDRIRSLNFKNIFVAVKDESNK